jgi:hypothetical protein
MEMVARPEAKPVKHFFLRVDVIGVGTSPAMAPERLAHQADAGEKLDEGSGGRCAAAPGG